MRERKVRVNDVELAVAESGDGGRPLLLVHGFTGAKEDFTEWLDRFVAQGWHAVAPDLRGHGSSSHPPLEADYSIAIFATDLIDLTRAYGVERFALLGHSMGGMIAQVMALELGQALSGLILMDTSDGPPGGLDQSVVDLGIEMARNQGLDAIADVLADLDSPLATPAYERLCKEQPDYAARCDRQLRATSPAMYAAMAGEIMQQPPRTEALGSLSLPVLAVVGDEDEAFIPSMRRIVATIPGATLAVIPDAGHSPQSEAPEPWWDAVSTFLAGLPAEV